MDWTLSVRSDFRAIAVLYDVRADALDAVAGSAAVDDAMTCVTIV